MMIAGIDNDSVAYLNGEYVRLGDAQVSVLDRGFIFGDGIYEVVPVYHGKPFRLAEHLSRLMRSLAEIRIDTGFSRVDWEGLWLDMIERSGQGRDCIVYLQVTRGVAKREHGFPKPPVRPTIFCTVMPLARLDAERQAGLSTVSLDDIRWHRCDIKSTSLLGNVLARQAATDAGVDDVIQFRDGWLSEGSSSNIWVVREGRLLAPLRDCHILEGIRYALIVELAQRLGIEFEERRISRDELAQADELLLSSATKEVLPIVRHDGHPVGGGEPGPVYRRLRAAYDEAIAAL